MQREAFADMVSTMAKNFVVSQMRKVTDRLIKAFASANEDRAEGFAKCSPV